MDAAANGSRHSDLPRTAGTRWRISARLSSAASMMPGCGPWGAYSVIDKVGMPHVLGFITGKLSDYDTAALDWVKLLPLNRNRLLHGACHFPFTPRPGARTRAHGYRIRASVNVEMAPPFSYIHWGRIPSPDRRQGWYSGEVRFLFDDLEECAVHTLSHECFHFLSHSRQVALKNTEANANWWADQWMTEFRSGLHCPERRAPPAISTT